ncbi:MAG: nitronate monooxygenase, partial [Solirubrobacteraceae bacterium]|nr:nitronate monooxygenase [Solirubrobacteraceae bacterium]
MTESGQRATPLPRLWAAPMAGGPSTPALAAAVGDAGGLGFLAAGYLSAEAFATEIAQLLAITDAPYGVNLFLPSERRGEPAALAAYADALRPLAARLGVEPGAPRWDDDDLAAKLDVVCAHRPAVVSFTFAAPPADVVARVRTATGAVVAATVTSPDEADQAVANGADALVVQGFEAGGHRGVFRDDPARPEGGDALPLLDLLTRVRARHPGIALVATGGIVDAGDVRWALDTGAEAVQLGTAFLLCPEAGTNAAHRRALRELDRCTAGADDPLSTVARMTESGQRATPLPRLWAAPMAGGPSTPALAAAVGDAGGLGFLAAGYLSAEAFATEIAQLLAITDAPYGVNLFLPSERRGEPAALAAYADALRPLAARLGVEPGAPRWDDDDLAAKLDVVCAHRPAVVSFTFAAPPADVVARVRTATGAVVAATVTSPDEADQAVANGADALVVQGFEAGGHRGVFRDDPARPEGGDALPLLDLLTRVRARHPGIALVATGGIVDAGDVRWALDTGAEAVQLGTAFLLCPEAGTNAAHRRALRELTATRITRAFTGRAARGLDNALARDPYGAPAAYPEVHHLTRPIRAAAAKAGDLETAHFWAGTGWERITDEPAGALT